MFIPSSRICVARTDLRTMWTVIGKIMLLHLLLMETQCVKGKRQYGFFFFFCIVSRSLSLSLFRTHNQAQQDLTGSVRVLCVTTLYSRQYMWLTPELHTLVRDVLKSVTVDTSAETRSGREENLLHTTRVPTTAVRWFSLTIVNRS